MSWTSRARVLAAALSLLGLIGAVAVGALYRAPSLPVAVHAAPPNVFVDPLSGLPTDGPGLEPSKPDGATYLGEELTTTTAPVPAGPSTAIPILLYHYIRVNPVVTDRLGFNLSTPPAMFNGEMQYLADHRFHVISLHAAVTAIEQHSSLPPRPVVLTFDDGYADFFTAALPILRAHDFTATDFVISGRMGVPGFMTPSQVRAADQQGFTIGAHTVDHYALATLAPSRASWEIRQSKLALEALLGHPVIDFAYPYGSYNAYAASQARALGFETAVSTLTGSLHTPAQLMYLSRLRVGGSMSLATFAYLIGGQAPTASPRTP